MKYLAPKLIAFILLCMAVSCEKSPTNQHEIPVDLSQAKLEDFILEEVAYKSLHFDHPELTNGVEAKRGEVHIIIPKGNTQLKLTPKSSNFKNDQFTITPQLGTLQNFSGQKLTYTIASKKDTQKKVHYDVTIEEEQDQSENLTEITGFKFEKSRNAALPSDIEAVKFVHDINGSIGKIFIFVPEGTDFSKLTPTISYKGQGLYYTQDEHSVPAHSTTTYPSNGIKIDFAFPKKFYAIVKNASEVKTYEVIVDVRNPIKFNTQTITTADVGKGKIHGLMVTGFTNQGNHPISLLSIDHMNQVPNGLNVIRAFGAVPSFGLNPKESIMLNISINAQTYPPGSYQTTAVFTPGIYHEPDADELLENSKVTINSTITE